MPLVSYYGRGHQLTAQSNDYRHRTCIEEDYLSFLRIEPISPYCSEYLEKSSSKLNDRHNTT